MKVLRSLQVKDGKQLRQDLFTGVVIALLSVPLSMGYAMSAGLPPVYGLYGSILPMLAFAFISTSPRCVFGVDAAPSAMVGGLLVELGIGSGSAEAVAVMPTITLLTAFWLLLMWLFRGGRFGKFISEPVLAGCITGIATRLILRQFPVMFGGEQGYGRAPELISHILDEFPNFHLFSFLLGAATVAAILLGRKRTRFSLSVWMMGIGILLGGVFHVDRYGVALLGAGAVPAGLPRLALPDFDILRHHGGALLLDTAAVALVIAAESLVSTREIGRKYGDGIDPQRELLAYGVGNLLAGLAGSSPVVVSVSRTNRANRREVKSQWMGISAPVVIVLVLLFAAPLLSWLPVPMLMGILIASLITVTEYSLCVELWHVDRWECAVFVATLAAELLGVSEGVIVGVVLSFATFTLRASGYPSYFLGVLRGRPGFYDLARTPNAQPIKGVVLYQFNGSLFYASIDDFERELLDALREDTRMVVITGIYSVDANASERLLHFYHKLKGRGIDLYLAGHAGSVNEQLISFGAEELIHNGVVRQRLTEALEIGGLKPPYPTEARDENEVVRSEALETFSWAYGKYASPRLEALAKRLSADMLHNGSLDFDALSQAEQELAGEYWSQEDEEEFLDLLEMSLAVTAEDNKDSLKDFHALARSLLERRVQLESQLIRQGDISVAREFIAMRLRREAEFLRSHPGAGVLLGEERDDYMRLVEQKDPEVAKLIRELEAEHMEGGKGTPEGKSEKVRAM